MLFRNDVFRWNGARWRLLLAEALSENAWAIRLDPKGSQPESIPWRLIRELDAFEEKRIAAPIQPTLAMLDARDRRLARLGDLPNQTPQIFEPHFRSHAIQTRAEQIGCSVPTLYKALRQYWTGGQTPAALLAQFQKCGHTKGQPAASSEKEAPVTGGRGAKPQGGKYTTYQLTETDLKRFRAAINRYYLSDERLSVTATYKRLLTRHYNPKDGNGEKFLLPLGERPTEKQFRHFLKVNYGLEHQLRKRKGDARFELENRPKLGTVLADCDGVGHYYEIDATIADVYLVATDDVSVIVGKPTIYLIVDRKSRLIVGWYVGLENASWIIAMQAIISISQDKQALCAQYGIEYDPADWPAHRIFPREFLADRGELIKRSSSQIADELELTVTNLPARRPDWKPIVESKFKQQRMTLQDGTPGFDPPENAKRRQGKHYEQDACLTLRDFSRIILRMIIAYNRKPQRGYDLSLKELSDQVTPSPLAIWNHNIVERSGVLTRYAEETVRHALLPRDEASVTDAGIHFRGCFYTSSEAVVREWFIRARDGRFKVEISFDNRLVDTIYVRHRHGVFECNLTARSEKYRGLSFAEVKVFEKLRRDQTPEIEQESLQVMSDLHEDIDPTIAAAEQRRKQAGKKSTSARRADTKEARGKERRKERQATAMPKPPPQVTEGNVLPFKAPAVPSSGATPQQPSNNKATQLQEAMDRMREGILNG
jgi:hypothetical protein